MKDQKMTAESPVFNQALPTDNSESSSLMKELLIQAIANNPLAIISDCDDELQEKLLGMSFDEYDVDDYDVILTKLSAQEDEEADAGIQITPLQRDIRDLILRHASLYSYLLNMSDISTRGFLPESIRSKTLVGYMKEFRMTRDDVREVLNKYTI